MESKKEETPIKKAIEKSLYGKKARSFKWVGDKLIGIVFADGTEIEAKDITVKAA